MEKIDEALWAEYERVSKAVDSWEGDVHDTIFIELQKQKNELLINLNKNHLSDVNVNIEMAKLKTEKEIKEYEQEQENKRNLFKGICTLVIGGGSLLISIIGLKKTFEFDKTATITSTLGRGIVNDSAKVNPNKFFKWF